MKIAIWGIGERTNRYIKFNYFNLEEVAFFIDTNRHGYSYYEKRVLSPEELKDAICEIDYVIVSTQYVSEIISICKRIGIGDDIFIYTDYINEPFCSNKLELIKQLFPKLYEDVRMRRMHLICENEKDDFDHEKLIGVDEFGTIDYLKDYCRFRTFEFVADELIKHDIAGNVAELGVYKGGFSALINARFPRKEILLFDTFEGFSKDEANAEKELGRSNEEFEFSHAFTSENIVLDKLRYRERAHIYKGLFPGTVTEEVSKQRFCFVSIDVDFEKSILEGLRFFYPRLNDGGYIFVHDYNSQYLDGVRQAVFDYEKEIGKSIAKVPLADRAGTLVLTK